VSNNSVDIKVLDKEYRVACPPEEQDALRASAEFLNGKLDEIRSKGSIIGTERIAVMAALNLAHELVTGQDYQDGYDDLDSRVGNLKKKINIALQEIEVS
jgi:cell division protein ZapA